MPLRQEQIDAAQAIYKSRYTEGLRRTDDALAALADAMRDFDPRAVLVKAAAVNSLYSTNVQLTARNGVDRVAQHVGEVLASVDLASAGPELVEEMAAIPVAGGRVHHCRSFASKFAHFFIDHDRFPIHDRFTAIMLRAHLGAGAPAPETGATYMVIEGAFRTLAQSAGLGSDTRRLDRYLWMIGQYREWADDPSARINSELQEVFELDLPELKVAAGNWHHPRA